MKYSRTEIAKAANATGYAPKLSAASSVADLERWMNARDAADIAAERTDRHEGYTLQTAWDTIASMITGDGDYPLERFEGMTKAEVADAANRYRDDEGLRMQTLNERATKRQLHDWFSHIGDRMFDATPYKDMTVDDLWATIANHVMDYRPTAPRPGGSNKPMSNGKNKPYATTGDASPFDYGGGIIYAEPDGSNAMWVVWPHVDGADEDDDNLETTVYIIGVADDVVADADWAKIGQVARSTGTSARELTALGKSADPRARVAVIEAIAGHYGYENFDGYPRQLRMGALKKQYMDDFFKAAQHEKTLPRISVDNGPPKAPLLQQDLSAQQRVLRACVKKHGKRSCMGSLMLLEQLAEAKTRDRVRQLRAFVAGLPGEPHTNPHSGEWEAIAVILVPYDVREVRLTETQVTELSEL